MISAMIKLRAASAREPGKQREDQEENGARKERKCPSMSISKRDQWDQRDLSVSVDVPSRKLDEEPAWFENKRVVYLDFDCRLLWVQEHEYRYFQIFLQRESKIKIISCLLIICKV